MTSQLTRFWGLFLSYRQLKNTKKGAVVTSLRFFLFCDDFNLVNLSLSYRNLHKSEQVSWLYENKESLKQE